MIPGISTPGDLVVVIALGVVLGRIITGISVFLFYLVTGWK